MTYLDIPPPVTHPQLIDVILKVPVKALMMFQCPLNRTYKVSYSARDQHSQPAVL
jgi:hypothetical protein